ncbi:MAG: glycosyltransferase [Filomicrobium sp.]
MLEEADLGFATTGGATLASFSDTKPLAYIPNPVDMSVDNHIAFEAKAPDIDVFFACDQPDTADRWVFAESVKEMLGPKYRVEYFGRRKGRPLRGDTYVRTLGSSRIGLNLNSREGELYASDRMAQLLGNGLLLATYSSSGFDSYFSDDEMLFFSDASSLAVQISSAIDGDQRWRQMAKAGRAKALKIMNEELVARFIVAIMSEDEIPSEWVFGDHVFNRSAVRQPRAVS